MEHVGAGLQHQIRDAPFGVAQGCVERCRFDLEFLDETLGGTNDAVISPALAVALLGIPSIVTSLRFARVPFIVKPTMCVGSNGR